MRALIEVQLRTFNFNVFDVSSLNKEAYNCTKTQRKVINRKISKINYQKCLFIKKFKRRPYLALLCLTYTLS